MRNGHSYGDLLSHSANACCQELSTQRCVNPDRNLIAISFTKLLPKMPKPSSCCGVSSCLKVTWLPVWWLQVNQQAQQHMRKSCRKQRKTEESGLPTRTLQERNPNPAKHLGAWGQEQTWGQKLPPLEENVSPELSSLTHSIHYC